MNEHDERPRTARLGEMDKIRDVLASLVPEGKHYESARKYVNKLLEVAAELPNPLEHKDALMEFMVIYLTAKATEGGTTDRALLAHINDQLAPANPPAGPTAHTIGPMARPPVGVHTTPRRVR